MVLFFGGALKRAVIFIVAALVACQRSETNNAQQRSVAELGALTISSKIAGIRIVPTSKLPRNPNPRTIDEYCSMVGYGVDHPTSLGGRMATKNGWIVTSETKLGDYDAVTFVGGLDAGTSAVCFPKNGNLGIFDGSRLRAIAYSPSDPVLAVAEQVDRQRIRLNTDTPTAPFADVVLRDGIVVEPTAKEDQVCRGGAVVPNIYGQDIKKARMKLAAYGWRPQRPSEPLNGGLDQELKAQGVIEVESCAGTGWGPCRFQYVHLKGFALNVISRGEEIANVISYAADCRPEEVRRRSPANVL